MTNSFEQGSSENDLAGQKDFERFHDEIQQAVKAKSEQLGETEEEIMEKLGVGKYGANIDADGNVEKMEPDTVDDGDRRFLDWESLGNIGNPKARGFSLAELEQIKGDILDSINMYPNFDSVSSILEFANKHNKKIKLVLVLLYFSSYGMPLFNALAEHNVEIETDKGEVSAKELLHTIDTKQVNEANIPERILQGLNVPQLSNEDGLFLKFSVADGNEVSVSGGVYDPSAGDPKERQEQFHSIIEILGKYFEKDSARYNEDDSTLYKISVQALQENRTEIVSDLASTMKISEQEVDECFSSLEKINDGHILVSEVSLEGIDLENNREAKGEITRFYEDVSAKHNMADPEEKAKAITECEQYAKENNIDNFWHALNEEKLNDPFSVLTSYEGDGFLQGDIANKVLSQHLKEHYNIEDLKRDPDRAYEAILQTIIRDYKMPNDEESRYFLSEELNTAIKYDQNFINKLIDGERPVYMPLTIESGGGDVVDKNIENWILEHVNFDELKDSQNSPEKTLQNISDFIAVEFSDAKGYSPQERCKVFMGIKYILTQNGLEGFDKFGIVLTLDEKGQPESKIITVGDDEEIDVATVNFTSEAQGDVENISPEQAHKSVMDKIKRMQQDQALLEILTTYNYDTELKQREKKIFFGDTAQKKEEQKKIQDLIRKIQKEDMGNLY